MGLSMFWKKHWDKPGEASHFSASTSGMSEAVLYTELTKTLAHNMSMSGSNTRANVINNQAVYCT